MRYIAELLVRYPLVTAIKLLAFGVAIFFGTMITVVEIIDIILTHFKR